MNEEEKAKLYHEVMSKNRRITANENAAAGELTLKEEEADTTAAETQKNASALNAAAQKTSDMLKSADSAYEQLRKILVNQQSDLQKLSEENGLNDQDMERVQAEIRRDYGLSEEEVEGRPVVRENIDSIAEFSKIEEEIKQDIVGQDEAIHSLCAAFRRPYVMGVEEGMPKNIILVTGPKGSGRHLCIKSIARHMKEHKLLASDEVYNIDLSRYSSGAQEQIFLQDLYKALSGQGRIVCFENFESGFAPFLRMINSLVCTGRMTLNKRYVLNKGMLIENQTGLVKNAIDSFSAAGFYLVFVSTKGPGAVQDAFGADFMYHVLDTVRLTAFTEEEAREYIALKEKELVTKAKSQLNLDLDIQPDFTDWVSAHYDKSSGADAINELFADFYVSISQQELQEKTQDPHVLLHAAGEKPVGSFDGKDVNLSRTKTSQEEIDAVNKELDDIVGLKTIKDYIHSLQSQIALNELRKAQGMKAAAVSKHMIFTGNPGTGKTTIARLISRYMKAIGALSQGQLVEVTRADLVAQYVGQTAPLTMSVIKSAMGGVLFIDEAYSLYRGTNDSFGLEAIDTIVKAMEDYRDDLIVILAGYKKEMAEFLEANSGLKSRFPNQIDFPDYTGEELLAIAKIQAKGKGYVIDPEAEKPLLAYFNKVQSINAAEAGNGRLSRNTVEEAILHQAERVMSHPGERLDLLKNEDFDYEVKVKPQDDIETMFQ
jgi:AAA+ superfamily predicted ATPase